MADNTVSTAIIIQDRFTSALTKLSAGLRNSQSGFAKLKGALTGAENGGGSFFKSMLGANLVGGAISKGVGLVADGARSMIGELGEAQTAWATFEGNMKQVGQSPKQIASARSELQKFAEQTIYSASDMSSTYSQLSAVGIKNVTKLVKGFGGLASSADNPKQAMKTLSQQATQMAALPTVQWMDFKLMLQQVPGGIAAVAKSMHKTTTELVQDVHNGKLKTQDFFDAISKVGTNANFSKMATQYKTVGQALDGLKENLANKLLNSFNKVSKVAIKWIEQIIDRLGKVDFDSFGKKVASAMKKVDFKSVLDNIGKTINTLKPMFDQAVYSVKSFISSFQMTGADAVISAFSNIGSAITNVMRALNGADGGTNLASLLGGITGTAVSAIADAISSLAQSISNMDPEKIRKIAGAIAGLVVAFKGLKVAGNLGDAISGAQQMFSGLSSGFSGAKKDFGKIPGLMTKLSKSVGSNIDNIQLAFQYFKSGGISGVVDAFNISLNPIGLAIAGVTALIVGGVMAWNDNFLGFRDFITGIFDNAGTIFQPLLDAFSNFGQALQPLFSVLQKLGQIVGPVLKGLFEGISVVAITGITVAIAGFADILKNVINLGTVLPNAVKVIIQGFHAIGDALKGNFSGAKKDIEDGANAVGKIKSALSGLGDFKITNGVLGQLSKFKLDSPKVKQPKVPEPKMPTGLKTIEAPKVKQPKVPTPQMPKEARTIPAPKVRRPVVPTPQMPKVQNIPAPHVGTPNMNGVVTAVSDGMARASATARAGGASLSSAVSSAVGQAVSAGTAKAGQMFNVGVMIGQGLANGMRSQIAVVASVAEELIAQADRASRAKAKIHSPSRLFAEIGDYMGQGLALGMNGTSSMVAQAGAGLIDSATSSGQFGAITGGSVGSGVIGAGSLTNANTSTTSADNRTFNIQPGAIVMNSTGNAKTDAESLLAEIEGLIMEKDAKYLGN